MPFIAGPASYPGLHSASLYDFEVPLEDCFVCAKHALGDAAPGGVLFEEAEPRTISSAIPTVTPVTFHGRVGCRPVGMTPLI